MERGNRSREAGIVGEHTSPLDTATPNRYVKSKIGRRLLQPVREKVHNRLLGTKVVAGAAAISLLSLTACNPLAEKNEPSTLKTPAATAEPSPTYKIAEADPRWAGYGVQGKQAINSVSTSFTIPEQFSCKTKDNSSIAIWTGITDTLSGDQQSIEQTGIEISCDDNGNPSYHAFQEMYPSDPDFADNQLGDIKPGDVIAASVNYVGVNQFLLSLTDENNDHSWKSTQPCPAITCQREYAVFVGEKSILGFPIGRWNNSIIFANNMVTDGSQQIPLRAFKEVALFEIPSQSPGHKLLVSPTPISVSRNSFGLNRDNRSVPV